jgi:hypothetical protein
MLLDMVPSSLVSIVFAVDERLKQKPAGTVVFHLTHLEKFLFIIGSICFATIAFKPVAENEYSGLIYNAFLNASTMLTICPLLSYLSRCSPTWTPLRCIIIELLSCLGCLLSALSGIINNPNLGVACNVLITVSCGFFFVLSLLSAWDTFRQKASGASVSMNSTSSEVDTFRRKKSTSIKHQDFQQSQKHQKHPRNKNDHSISAELSEQRFRDGVVGVHVITALFYQILTSVWYWYTSKLNAQNYSIIMFSFVAFATAIFVTEARVRKHEIKVTMVSTILCIWCVVE